MVPEVQLAFFSSSLLHLGAARWCLGGQGALGVPGWWCRRVEDGESGKVLSPGHHHQVGLGLRVLLVWLIRIRLALVRLNLHLRFMAVIGRVYRDYLHHLIVVYW